MPDSQFHRRLLSITTVIVAIPLLTALSSLLMLGAGVDVIRARLWRIPRNEIPTGRRERLEWLFRIWEDVDEWGFEAARGFRNDPL